MIVTYSSRRAGHLACAFRHMPSGALLLVEQQQRSSIVLRNSVTGKLCLTILSSIENKIVRGHLSPALQVFRIQFMQYLQFMHKPGFMHELQVLHEHK